MNDRTDDLQIDPRLRQQLLLRTDSTTAPDETGARAGEIMSVVARLDPGGSEVPGLQTVSRFGSIVTGRVRLAEVFTVRRHPAVRSLKASRTYAPTLAVSVPEIRARPADWPPPEPGLGGDSRPLSGAGVVVAVLDWGLDVTHSNLRHPDGSTRVLALWDQRGGRTASSPQPFDYGRVLTAAEIDAALRTPDPHATLGYDHAAIDPRGEGTHGTHVADIAVGNGRAGGSAPGVAPGADLLFVHLRGDDTRPEDALGDSARLLEAVDWSVRTARGLATAAPGESVRPVVVHLSLGRTGGPHDASPLIVRALDHLLSTTPGVAVVLSCGNYYGSRLHAATRVGPGITVELPWHIPAPSQEAEMEIWYSGTDRLHISLWGPDGQQLADLPLSGEAVVRDDEGVIVSGFHRRAEPNSGANMADLFVLGGAPSGVYRVRMRGEEVHDGRVHAWIERTAPHHQSHFPAEVATPEFTTGSICNGWLPLSVGAYDARTPERSALQFSSSGPTRDDRRKPDLSAPGSGIVAARSSVPDAAGGRRRDGVVAKSGTSMAAPHVSGTVALVFETAAPRLLPMAVTRWILLESARREPPTTAGDGLRYGAGRVDAHAACVLARALLTPPADIAAHAAPPVALSPAGEERPEPSAVIPVTPVSERSSTMTIPLTRPEAVLEWLNGTGPGDDQAEAVVGQLRLAGTRHPVDQRGAVHTDAGLDAAIQGAFARGGHTVITADGAPPTYRSCAFGPATPLPAPVVATFEGAANVQALVLNGGQRVLLGADPTAPGTRWLHVSGLQSLYRLPAADSLQIRNTWADRLTARVAGLPRATARALPAPLLRLMLAHHVAAAFPVGTIRRGTPPADAGGVVHGITVPMPELPLTEPHCYLSVIAQVEGKLESINAWDAGAGVSLGPIQFNVQRGALFRFLGRLWTDDPDLFTSALTGPLGWSMSTHGDHLDLVVARTGGTDTLHGRVADTAANVAYLQTGRLGGTGRDGPYRRRVAAALRDCVVWPHVQDMVVDVSAWWLSPALAAIRAEGVGPLDPVRPDRDTFVLTALLLSAGVRYSGCLRPLLTGLRRWSSVADKLAHWEEVVQATGAPCPKLVPRLRSQVGHARHVHDQVLRLTATPSSSGPESGDNVAEVLDTTVGITAPTSPSRPTAAALSASRSTAAQTWNTERHPTRSGVSGQELVARLAFYVDLTAARAAASAAGVTGGTPPFDAGCIEALHQFQAGAFSDAGQVDGKAGDSTMDTLGLVRRSGMNAVRQPNAAAQRRLDQAGARLRTTSGSEFTPASWWEGMVNPAWLGRRFSNGIHTVLARRLRQVEALLLSQPRYAGMSGVELGRALGITEGHGGARPGASTASMHTFGLAVDVQYGGNPWIVGQHVDGGSSPSPAGLVIQEANRALTQAVNRAALLVHGAVIAFTPAYLARLSAGTAGAAWDDLSRRNEALVRYLALAGDVPAIRALVTANRAVAGVLQPGETIDAASQRWASRATADLTALRAGSVTRKDSRGQDVTVSQSNFSSRDPRRGFLSLHRDLVVALRDGAGLAWGAIDFGPNESGDVMHFDCRRDGVGALLHNRPTNRPRPVPEAVTDADRAPTAAEWMAEAVNRQSREYIRWYQEALNRIDGAGLAVDGISGPLTRGAVRRYQTRKALDADGIVGPITERALMLDGAGPPPGYSGPPISPLPSPRPAGASEVSPGRTAARSTPAPPVPVPPVPPVPPAPVPPKPLTSLSSLESRYFPPPGGADAAPFSRMSSVEPIIDGRDYFAQLKALIDSLTSGDAWYVAAWWLDPLFRFADGARIGDLLVDRASSGVDVRVIVWANRQVIDHPTLAGMFGAAPFQRVVRSNIKAAEDLRRRRPASGRTPLAGRVLIDWSGNAASSHHMKLNVFSRGRVLTAFVGGIDYLQNRLDNPMHRPPTSAWHDAGVRVQGDAANRVLSTYVTRWTEASTLSAASYDIGSGAKPYNPPPLVALTPPASRAPLPPSSDTSVQVVRSIMDSKEFGLVRNTPWSTLPRNGVHETKRTFQQALGAAQRYIYIEDQAFTATDTLFPSLVSACRRGVKVVAVLPGAGDPLDAPGTVPRVLSAEVRSGILGHLTPAQQLNLAVWQLAGITVHSKLFLIDDEMFQIGSANFMDRSMGFTLQGDDSECAVAVVSTASLVPDLRVRLWAEHLRVSGAAPRAELRDLSRSLGFWRPAWGTGLTFPHPDSRLIFVGPTPSGSGGSP